MKQRTDQLYLQHILDAISKIESYLDGVDEEPFRHQPVAGRCHTPDSDCRRSGQAGLSGTLRAKSGNPVARHGPCRDKLVHDYFGVDIGMVWITATIDLAELHAQVTRVLSGL
jgi:uncharacterized protein with HEPN domain